MAYRLGVRWRLFLAFFGISAFAILAAVAAIYSILAVGGVLERLTQERVPAALASLEISRQAERIVAAAPTLLTATTTAQREELRSAINADLRLLEDTVAGLKSNENDASVLASIGFAKLIAKDFARRFLPLVGGDAKLRQHSERIGENLGIIVGEAERLTRLINDVLDISKIESGATEWRDADVEVAEVVNQVFVSAQGQFSDNPAVVAHLQIADALPPLRIDRDRLVQVLINLLHNAAKFTEAGRVELRVGTTGEGWVSFAVSDTGRGIPQEEQELVFDKFHQVTKSDTLEDKPKGTGLGLTICRQIVEHYGGRIWVESEVGFGSTFTFVLPPAGWEDPAPIAEPVPEPAERRAEHEPLIMVVDDDPAIRAYLSQLLGEEGYQVVTAESGTRALELPRDAPPDLITMDLKMPGLDERAVIAELRRERTLRDVPIIVVSVMADRHDAAADLSLGKPIDEVRLLSSTRLLLRRSRQRPQAGGQPSGEQFLAVDMPGKRTQVPPLPDGATRVRHCAVAELGEQLRNGFDGTVVLAAEAIREIDLQDVLAASKVRVVIISSLEASGHDG